MIRNETRESAHLRSRVKDLSVVPNVVDYTGLFAAITPIAKLNKNADGLYDPVLIRDTDSLIANFGDPRIDPKKYIDLYSIMQVVGNGTSCYVAKVNSGDSGVYKIPLSKSPIHSDDAKPTVLTPDKDNNRRYYIDNLNNKSIVTGFKGYNEAGTQNPGETSTLIVYSDLFATNGKTGKNPVGFNKAGEVDFSDKYTWECVKKTDGKFKIIITLTEDPKDITTLIVTYTTDPSWGAEPINVEVVTESTDPTKIKFDKVSDADNAVYTISVTLKSNTKLEHEYILLDSAIKSLIDSLKVKINIAETDDKDIIPEITGYKFSSGYLEITVKYTGESSDDLAKIEGAISVALLDKDTTPKPLQVTSVTRSSHSLIAYSSMSEDLKFKLYVSQTKPYSLKIYYLNIEVMNADGVNILGSARVKLEDTTTNQGLVNNLNSALGTIVRFDLIDPSTEAACVKKDRGANSIVKILLDNYCQDTLTQPVSLEDPIVDCSPNFHVSMNDYIAALEQYKARKYSGCLMADLVAPVSRNMSDDNPPAGTVVNDDVNTFMPSHEERRVLHYNLKQIACERKDCTVVLSTPYYPSKDNMTVFTVNDACDWVTSTNAYSDLWEYGVAPTVDYSIQSFYLEMYFSWLNQTCTKIESGLAKSVKVLTAPSNLVINNILTSYRERGVNYPVAGDQYGTLPTTCDIMVNPKTKAERDQLVQSRINPIYDTGTRGIQIYGNETLNAGYTDLNAAHIARTLVNIRHQVDEYTETLKFLINSQMLWDQWQSYVSMYVLEPFKAANALAEYSVKMGEDTTSKEEIANRTINGIINLRFYQSCEIFDLSFVVYSTATTLDAEGAL